jgi:hypothetical protein
MAFDPDTKHWKARSGQAKGVLEDRRIGHSNLGRTMRWRDEAAGEALVDRQALWKGDNNYVMGKRRKA